MSSPIVSAFRGLDRAFWFAVHGWLALPIWALLALVTVTGTLCTISQEITWLIQPEVRAGNPRNLEPLSFDAVGRAAVRHTGGELTAIRIDADYLAWRIQLREADGDSRELLVNPYDGRVQGEIRGLTLRAFLLALHGWLLLPWHGDFSIGWYVVTALSVPLLGSLGTGLVVYRKFWRGLLRPSVRTNRGLRVLLGDWHRLAGAWSLVFGLLIGLSGVWFLVNGVLDHRGVALFPPEPSVTTQSPGAGTSGVDLLPAIVSNAQRTFPDMRITAILFPEDADGAITVLGRRGWSLLRDSANRVYLDPGTGNVVGALGEEQLPPFALMQVLMRPLHFGDFGGLVVKLLWFFFGCVMSTLLLSGLMTWSLRTTQAITRARQKKVLPAVSGNPWKRRFYSANHWLMGALLAWIVVSLYSTIR